MRTIRKALVETDTYIYTLGPEIPLLHVLSRKCFSLAQADLHRDVCYSTVGSSRMWEAT